MRVPVGHRRIRSTLAQDDRRVGGAAADPGQRHARVPTHRFESASRQRVILETLLPLSTVASDSGKAAKASSQIEYEFLPSAREILEELLPAAFKARLFKCFLDAAVSEQIFRRVAMKSATENAGEMIGDLSRIYNRARQSQITSELSEIIGGAEALA